MGLGRMTKMMIQQTAPANKGTQTPSAPPERAITLIKAAMAPAQTGSNNNPTMNFTHLGMSGFPLRIPRMVSEKIVSVFACDSLHRSFPGFFQARHQKLTLREGAV